MQKSGTADSEILDEIARDATRGYRLLFRVYGEPVYWHIRRITVSHHDAEDVTQETFLRVFRHIGGYRRGTSFRAWIYRIATNEALRWLDRRAGVVGSIGDVQPGEVAAVPADEYVDYSDLEAVRLRDAILSLPPKQQVTFNLRYYDGFDYAAIAEITGSTPAAAKANYHTAKSRIIDYMTNHD